MAFVRSGVLLAVVPLLAACESPDGGDRAFRIAGEIRAGGGSPGRHPPEGG